MDFDCLIDREWTVIRSEAMQDCTILRTPSNLSSAGHTEDERNAFGADTDRRASENLYSIWESVSHVYMLF